MNNKKKNIDIDKMTKSELKTELDDLRYEHEKLKVKTDIIKLLDRFVTIDELEKIRDFAEKIYKNETVKNWGFLYGMRDNIIDMADNLAEIENVDELQYLAHFMFGMLLDKEPSATDRLYTMTPTMKEMLLDNMTSKKVV